MNKRIKLKKGILHKKCDDKCVNRKIIVDEKLVTSTLCRGCKHRAEIDKVCRKNYLDNRPRYKGVCCSCGATFYACKSIGIEIGWLDKGYGMCLKCDTSMALKFNEDDKTVDVELWEDYRTRELSE